MWSLIGVVMLCGFHARAEEEEAVKVYRAVSPAVVSLSNVEGSGTGVIVGADGLILTNAHVVTSPLPFSATVDVMEGGKTREVTFKKVEVVGYHPKLDLALVKVNPAEQHVTLRAATIFKTPGQAGQRVYVIGNPAAGKTVLTKSITSGMLSAADRQIPGEPGSYYQIDAAINPGNSGGPMCDREGRVLGIVTFKFTEAAALGFAIPLNDQEISIKAFVPLNKRAGNPERAQELLRMADRFSKLGDLAMNREGPDSETRRLYNTYAAMCYRMALMHDPSNSIVYENIGTLLRTIDEDDVASAYLIRSLQLKPWGTGGGESNANAYRELGLSLAKQKKMDQALAGWTEGITKFPYADKVWEDLAIGYMNVSRFADAAEAATIATLTSTKGTRVNVMRAIIRDAHAAAEKAGQTTSAMDARIERSAIIAKLDLMLSQSNAARKARKIYVTPAFATLIKDMGGPDIPGADQTIPQQPRERLAEFDNAGGVANATPKPTVIPKKPTAKPEVAAKPAGDDWLGAGAKEPAKPVKPSVSTPRTGTAGPKSPGWLGNDGGSGAAGGKPVDVKPEVTGTALAQGKGRTIVDAEVRALDLKHIVGALWSRDGKFVYLLDKEGTLRKVSVPDLVEERQIKLGGTAGALALAKGGLVVAMTAIQEVWVLDEQTLNFKKRATTPKLKKVVAAPDTVIAYADFGPDGLTLINTETGQVVGQITARELTEQRGAASQTSARFFFYELTPDGKYMFCEGGECLNRLRVQGTKLIFEEAGPRIGANVQSIVISADGRYVAMPSGGGNGRSGEGTPYTTFVYSIADLQKAVIILGSGAYPHTIGFDFPAKQLYAQNHDTTLMVFTPRGLKGKEYKIPRAGDAQRFLVHPEGKKVLILTDTAWWMELP